MKKIRDNLGISDTSLIIVLAILVLFGVIMAYDSTVVYAYNEFGGKYHFLFSQTGWVILGLIVATLAYHFNYHYYPSVAFYILGFSIILLLLVFVPGIGTEIYGANRWFYFGSISFQPSELAKLALIIYLSSLLTPVVNSAKRMHQKTDLNATVKNILPLVIMVLVIILQKHLSTTLIIVGISGAIFFSSGARLKHIMILGLVLFGMGSFLIITSPYRVERLKTYINPQSVNVLDEGYHINQIKIAIGSGGFMGRGLGQSRQKYEYLPEVCADSVFAVVAEEMGLIGATVLLSMFLFVILKGYMIAQRVRDDLGKLLAVGVTSWFALQVFINLSAMVGIIPLTGVTLPFISCGGSSAIATLAGVGVLLNVSRNCHEK